MQTLFYNHHHKYSQAPLHQCRLNYNLQRLTTILCTTLFPLQPVKYTVLYIYKPKQVYNKFYNYCLGLSNTLQHAASPSPTTNSPVSLYFRLIRHFHGLTRRWKNRRVLPFLTLGDNSPTLPIRTNEALPFVSKWGVLRRFESLWERCRSCNPGGW